MLERTIAKGLELPDEIWVRIVQHIPSGSEHRLYAVNRPLFYIVLSFRYERLRISNLSSPLVQKKLHHNLRSPYVTNNVKEIEFTLGELEQYLKFPRKQDKLLERFFKWPLPPIEPDPSVRALLKTLSTEIDLSSHFPALHTAQFLYRAFAHHTHHYDTFLTIYKPYIRNALQSISANLRCLLLDIPLEFYRDGVLNHPLFFPSLNKIDLSFGRISGSGPMDVRNVELFVIRHSKTLKSLALRFRDHSFSFMVEVDNIDYADGLFHALSNASRNLGLAPSPASTPVLSLSELIVHFPLNHAQQSGLHALPAFISAHARTLNTLHLLLYDPRDDAGTVSRPRFSPLNIEPLLMRTIPCLQTLTTLRLLLLYEESFLTDPEPLLNCISSAACVETLVTLDLGFNRLKQEDVVRLISQNHFSSLRSFTVKLNILTMALFDSLADHLPVLQTLKVITALVQARTPERGAPEAGTPPLSPLSFLADLQTSSYSHWKSLSNLALHLIPRSEHRPPWASCQWDSVEDPDWLTEGQVRDAFPTVRILDLYVW
ncbi:hypothetical protein D9611_000774 [Ephemerocybe angulata]|uniref:Uncharacterized protein n=1 Tax=Ephemerocybe angulata TaxID=980116 RepID=A0A8H5F7E9_9AGAR|nr:hypothetical protein D9611_000774 [Tulosesus angulatus]